MIAVVMLPVVNKLMVSKKLMLLNYSVAVIICNNYIIKTIMVLSPYPVFSYLIKPLMQVDYFKRNVLKSFPKIALTNGVVMFIDDETHNCINAPLLCFPRHFPGILPPQIKMRGNKIEDGFKTINK